MKKKDNDIEELKNLINTAECTDEEKTFLKAMVKDIFGKDISDNKEESATIDNIITQVYATKPQKSGKENDTDKNYIDDAQYSIVWSEKFQAPAELINYCKENNLPLSKSNDNTYYFDHIKINTEEPLYRICKSFLGQKGIILNSLDYKYDNLWDIKIFKIDGTIHVHYCSMRKLIEEANHLEDNCYIKWADENGNENTECINPHKNKQFAYDADKTIYEIWKRFSHKKDNVILKNIQISKIGITNGFEERPGIHLYPDLNNKKTTKLSGIEIKKFDNWTLYKIHDNKNKVAREIKKAFINNSDNKEYTDMCEEFKDYLYKNYDDVDMGDVPEFTVETN